MNKQDKILLLGHSGLGGGAMYRRLVEEGFENIMCVSKEQGDLTDDNFARLAFEVRPDYVFLFAARVGGILANSSYPVEFLEQNMRIELNVMREAHRKGVKKLLFIGTACAYPKFAPVPISESSLLTGVMEPTNLPYALAKISGVVLCDAYRKQYGRDFISCMPTNLYGVGDTYHLSDSHVVPGMIMKMHAAKKSGEAVVLWGTGTPRREFLYAADLASACLLLMKEYSDPGPVNIGSLGTISMKHLATCVAKAVGFSGDIIWDNTRPDGTPNREIDSTQISKLGWKPSMPLERGLQQAYRDYLDRYES